MRDGGAGVPIPLLERDAEIETLEHALEAATAEDGRLVLLVGSAGVGKTRLVDVAAEHADSHGAQALRARGAEVDQDVPFGVILQLLQRRILKAHPDERTELLAGAAGLAQALLTGGRLAHAEGAEAAAAIEHGLYWLVANMAERAPLLLAVDDAHWADAASLRFLVSMANRLDGLAVMMLLVRRSGELGAGNALLDRIAESPDACVIELRPLSDPAIAALVRHRYDRRAEDSFCEACARAVHGNPLYLRELLTELGGRGLPASAASADEVGDVDIASVARSVNARLARAGADAVALAEATSVSDGALQLGLVARLAGVKEDAAQAMAQALCEADILMPDDPLQFVHPVVRSSVYARLSQHRRYRLHRATAELLREAGALAERVAAHLRRSEAQGDAWAAETLVAAATSAVERGAPQTAGAYLRQALEEDPPAELRATILAELGLAGVASGDPNAVDVVSQAAALARSASDRARYLLLASGAAFYIGRFAEAFAFAYQAFDEVDEQEDEDAAGEVAGYLTGLNAVTRRRDEVVERRFEALCDRISMRPGLPRTLAERLVPGVMGGVKAMRGELPADRVRELARRSLATAPGEEIRSVMFQPTMALSMTDDFEDAGVALSRSMEAARRRGYLHDFTMASYQRADPRYRAGRIADAIADAESAMDGARQGIDGFEPPTRAVLALCLLDSGDVDGAERAIDIGELQRWSGITHLARFHEARGFVLLARGHPLGALEDFRSAGAITSEAGAINPAFCAWRSGAALAEHALGNNAEARRLASEEVELARSFGAARAIGIALRAQGLVDGDIDRGLELLTEAVAVLADSPARLELARTLLDLGAALRRAGYKLRARDELRRAVEISLECGAHGLADRAREELIAAGGRPRRDRLTSAAALTPQELRVARLAAEGHSNRDIAQALFLTRKTIETHLSAAYGKLGIRSRDELPDALDGSNH